MRKRLNLLQKYGGDAIIKVVGIYKAKSIKVAEAVKVIEMSARILISHLWNELAIVFIQMDTTSDIRGRRDKMEFSYL